MAYFDVPEYRLQVDCRVVAIFVVPAKSPESFVHHWDNLHWCLHCCLQKTVRFDSYLDIIY